MFCVFDMSKYGYDKSILLPHHLELGNDERCSLLQFFHFLKTRVYSFLHLSGSTPFGLFLSLSINRPVGGPSSLSA